MARLTPDRTQSIETALVENPRQLEVLRFIRSHGVVTRAEIGEALHSSASQVSRLTAPLIAQQIVTVEPRQPFVEGRPTELLALADDAHFVVGLDIGGLAQDAVVTNLRGDIVGEAHAISSPPDSRSSIISWLTNMVDRVVEQSGVPREQVLGVGVGVRAIVDPVSGVISAGPETPTWSPIWVDFDLRHQLASALPWGGLVIDDTVRALAAAERQYGHARRADDFVYLLADSGIGAAIMIDGQSYIGPGHFAGEVGHITLDRDGPMCGCGRRGCVEMYASTSAMLGRARMIDPSVTSMSDLIARAAQGAMPLAEILSDGGEALGRATAILLNLLSPALVVIGGSGTESTLYMERVRARAQLESLEQPFRTARIVTSDSRENAGALGAATLMLNQLFGAPVANRGVRQRTGMPARVQETRGSEGEQA